MTKEKWIVSLGCFLLLVILAISLSGRKPYRDLDTAEIASATVHLILPDETRQVSELKELVGYLNDLVIYQQDNSYTEYSGQSVCITLTMRDGSRQEIIVASPFVILNGTGYRAEYVPCERLNRYANELLTQPE